MVRLAGYQHQPVSPLGAIQENCKGVEEQRCHHVGEPAQDVLGIQTREYPGDERTPLDDIEIYGLRIVLID